MVVLWIDSDCRSDNVVEFGDYIEVRYAVCVFATNIIIIDMCTAANWCAIWFVIVFGGW